MTDAPVTDWSHNLVTDRRTGRFMERRTPHAVPSEAAGGELPILAACGTEVHEVGELVFPPTRSLASMQEPCGDCIGRVGRVGRR
jgi:hypothetical protein